MGILTANLFVTLDGVYQAPGGLKKTGGAVASNSEAGRQHILTTRQAKHRGGGGD